MDNYVENFNRIKELADQIKILDLLDPTSQTVLLITEMVDRCKHIPKLEMIDNSFINNFEAEA